MSTGKRVKLALGSGGARGYAHIGVIAELEERGYEIVGVAGSSMGAVVGGLFAAGRLDEFTTWATNLRQLGVVRMLDPVLAEPGIIRADRVVDLIREILGDLRIEDLPIPYAAVATDLTTSRSIWFQDGDLNTAIRASIAIPGFITPLLVDGHVFVDGGVLDPLPVPAAATLGPADKTIAVNLSGPADRAYGRAQLRTSPVSQWCRARAQAGAFRLRAGTPGDRRWVSADISATAVAQRSVELMLASRFRPLEAANPPDLVIDVPQNICGVMDFHRAESVIVAGRELAADVLDALPDGRLQQVS
ncbi:patatin-like phospholipase family protein [Nocardia sp. NPDC004123]